jgi:hypothetical protein
MQVYYLEPFSRAWKGMTKALLKPFDIRKWLVMGFTAFLANLASGGLGGHFPTSRRMGRPDLSAIRETVRRAIEWLMGHPFWVGLILFIVVACIAIGVLLAWLSSRGKFMFLDNVVRDRAEIVEPWHQYKSQGDSLFLWRLGFGLASLAVWVGVAVWAFMLIRPRWHGLSFDLSLLGPIILMALVFLTLGLVTAYISMMTTHFVVPLMYKHNLRILAAWGRFLPLLRQQLPFFLLYGLVLLLMYLVVGICFVVGGLVTCCCLFLILAIPYVGSVITLPIAYAFRVFSLEFLAQFGPEYTLLSTVEENISSEPLSPPPAG